MVWIGMDGLWSMDGLLWTDGSDGVGLILIRLDAGR